PACFVAERRELVTIKSCADIVRRRIGKRIVREERERAAIVVPKFPDEVQRPRILCRRRHGRDPDLPVDARLVRRDERRASVGIGGFSCEFVFFPSSIASDGGGICYLKNNFVWFVPNLARSPKDCN